jgi:hypothetical protein
MLFSQDDSLLKYENQPPGYEAIAMKNYVPCIKSSYIFKAVKYRNFNRPTSEQI